MFILESECSRFNYVMINHFRLKKNQKMKTPLMITRQRRLEMMMMMTVPQMIR